MLGSRGKVLILDENLPVPFDRRVWLEATALRDAGYTVSIICPTGTKYAAGYELLEQIHVHRFSLPQTGTSFMAFVREFAVALAKSFWLSMKVRHHPGFDAIHACNPPDLFFLIAWLYRPLGKRFVYDVHDLTPETYRAQKSGREGLVYRILLLLEHLTYTTADMVIATNDSIRRVAEERGKVSSERIFVVRTGPDFKRLHTVPTNPALKKEARYLVCYVGVMGPQDGVDYALRAAKSVICELGRSDVQFAFIGDGDARPSLCRLADDLGIAKFVSFTGRISDAELVTYLSTADLCMSPDPQNGLNEFHTMNKTLEYMAMGKAQVAFDITEMRVSAGESAAYARPNDTADFGRQIVTLLDDPERRARMGEIGRNRIETELGWSHTQKNLILAYQWLFEKFVGRTV